LTNNVNLPHGPQFSVEIPDWRHENVYIKRTQ